MSTRSRKKTKKKPRSRLQLRSKHRRSANKTKRKSIGLKSQHVQILPNGATRNTTTLKMESSTHIANGETKPIANTMSNSPQPFSSVSSSLSSSIQSSSNSTQTHTKSVKITKRFGKRRKNASSQIGVNKDQLILQQHARINKKKEKFKKAKLAKFTKDKLAKTIIKNKILQINAKNINKSGLTMDDILPMCGENVDIDPSIHILNNLGKHKIHIHNETKSKTYIGLLRINGNIEEFRYLKVDDILSINNNLTLKISCIDGGGATNWNLSIDDMIAKEYHITPHTVATIRHINPLSLELSQIEVVFKNQYISRGKLWKIEGDLVKRIVHVNEHIKCIEKGYDLNIKQMKSLAKEGEVVSCGLITSNTKFLFRSNSACFIYLVQLSKEMWDFNKKQIHFETFIDGFLKTLMAKWKQNDCNHAYSIIFFSRTFYDYDHVKHLNASINKSRTRVFNKDSDDRYYRDHYMVVVRNWSTNNWNKLSQKLREAFDIFPRRVKWKRNINKISVASEGNLLEAIQLALNVLDKHYIDRDLHRSGLSITVVTAGNGHFFVDKALATFTKVRILNNGINCDLVSMSQPPLHPTPLFIYGSPLAFEQNNWETLSYYQPTEIIQIKFFNYSPYNETPIASPHLLFTKTASFLAIKNVSKTFVPLPLGDLPLPTSKDDDFYNIYLPNDCWNLHKLEHEMNDYDDHIFAALPQREQKSKAIPHLSNTSPQTLPTAAVQSTSPLASMASITHHTPRYATINKRAARNDRLHERMLGDTTDSDEEHQEEGLVDDVGDDPDEPNVGTLKKMFMASKQDGDDINDNDPLPQFETSRSVIVIQHKDSYHQNNSIKNTLSALDPSNTPFNHPSSLDVDSMQMDEFSLSACTPAVISDECEVEIDTEFAFATTITPRVAVVDRDETEEKEKEVDSDRDESVLSCSEWEHVHKLAYGDTHPFRTKWNQVLNERNKRFCQIYPLPHQYCGFLFPSSSDDQWKTFVSPAILPLTNDTDFKENVLDPKYVHQSTREIGVNVMNDCLLDEMVLQRLTQDFQLMKKKIETSNNDNIRIHVLNTQTYIHQLKHIRSETNIYITRYVDNRLADKESNILYKQMNPAAEEEADIYQQVLSTFSLPYNYNLWNHHRDNFQNYTVKLAEQHQLYYWFKLDKVCAGYSDDIENDLKARRVRFALISKHVNHSNDEIIKHFSEWFTKITAMPSIKKCGIEIINRDSCYYDPSTWNKYDASSRDTTAQDSDPSQIGFDSRNEIKKANRMHIKLESEWFGRKTFLIIKYDTIYDPNVVFHFQIYWLIATGSQICKFIENIKKCANGLQLQLIAVPSAQPKKIADPFLKTLRVESQTKILNKNVKIVLQKALIHKFGFMLDTHYATRDNRELRFMHRDGCAIVRWHDGGFLKNAGFTWVPNNYKKANYHQFRKQSIELFRDFRKYFHETITKYMLLDDIIHNVVIKNTFLAVMHS